MTKCSTLGSARRNCGGSISYAKRETTPKVRLEPKKYTQLWWVRAELDQIALKVV